MRIPVFPDIQPPPMKVPERNVNNYFMTDAKAFVEKIKTESGRDDLSYIASDYIGKEIGKQSFTDRLQPPEQIHGEEVIAEWDNGEQADTHHIKREMEPYSTAVGVRFKDDLHRAVFVKNEPRYEIPMGTWATELSKKSEAELLSFEEDGGKFDFYGMLRSLDIRELSRQKDDQYMMFVSASLKRTGQIAEIERHDNFRDTLSILATPIIHNQLRPYVYLVSEVLLTKIMEDLAINGAASETLTIGDYHYVRIAGRMFIPSLATDMFDEYDTGGELISSDIYCFTSPDALGHSVFWGPRVKFWCDYDEEKDVFVWSTYQDGGMGIAHVDGISKTTIFSPFKGSKNVQEQCV